MSIFITSVPVIVNGRVLQRYWVNFQCWGFLVIRIIVGQGPIALTVRSNGVCLSFFLLFIFFMPPKELRVAY